MKLTKAIREAIIKKIEKDKFSARIEALKQQENQVALACYLEIYSKEYELAMKLPECWRRMDSNCWVNYKDENGIEKTESFYVGKEVPFPQFNRTVAPNRSGKAHQSVIAYLKARSKLEDERSEVANALEVLFESARTVKRLLEIWPEAKEFLPNLESTCTALVPKGLTDKLNTMLNLKAA